MSSDVVEMHSNAGGMRGNWHLLNKWIKKQGIGLEMEETDTLTFQQNKKNPKAQQDSDFVCITNEYWSWARKAKTLQQSLPELRLPEPPASEALDWPPPKPD